MPVGASSFFIIRRSTLRLWVSRSTSEAVTEGVGDARPMRQMVLGRWLVMVLAVIR